MSISLKQRHELSADERALLKVASAARSKAYAPYSDYYVGAAVRSVGGQIHAAANLENASYGLSLCAEACALAVANAAGDFENLKAVAIVGGPATKSTETSSAPVTPCGRCRQLILEAAQAGGQDITVICGVEGNDDVLIGSIKDFLPEAFGPMNLGLVGAAPSPGNHKRKAAG